MSDRFAGKAVLVTGGASGIGLATARAFADEGADVMIADRDEKKAAAAARRIGGKGRHVKSIEADVSDPMSCESMVAATVAAFGGLHIAFNNAGIPSSIGGLFEHFALADWDRLLATNLSGVFYSIRAEVGALKASGGTAIVNTASVASLVAAQGMAAYVAAKHGVAGLTKAAALDLIPYGIRVNAVCPGFVDTPMLAGSIEQPEARASIESLAPIGRIAAPEEIARIVLFLASEESSYMVGTLVAADGGVSVA